MAELPMLAQLKDENDRLALLQRLVDQLTVKERSALSSMISKKNDVLARLPVELVIAIMDHLPILHTWKLQIVCRHWRDLLSSEQLLSAALTRWATHAFADRVLTKVPPNMTLIQYNIRHMQSFRLGRPFTRAVKSVNRRVRVASLNQSGCQYALAGHLVAYQEDVGDACGARVIVMDLINRSQVKYQGNARESIMCVALTTTIIAYISYSGRLYTSYHDYSRLGSTQLPSACVLAFHADQDKVAIILGHTPRTGNVSLLIFDCALRSTKMHQIHIPRLNPALLGALPGNSTPRTVLLDAEAETVDVFCDWYTFTDVARVACNSYVDHHRYTFDGEEKHTSSWARTGSRLNSPRIQSIAPTLGEIHSAGYAGLYFFRTSFLESADHDMLRPAGQRLMMLLCFDARSGRLFEHTFDNDQRTFAESSGGGTSSSSRHTFPALWKDVELRALPSLYFSTQTDEAVWNIEGRYRVQSCLDIGTGEAVHGQNTCTLLVNDSFMVAFHKSDRDHEDLHIFCFEEELGWGGEGLTVTCTGLWSPKQGMSMPEKGASEHRLLFAETFADRRDRSSTRTDVPGEDDVGAEGA